MILLLTDAMERSTLAAARALVAGGHTVHVVTPRRRSLAGASRGVHELILEADPLRGPAAWADGVADLARRVGAEAILPMTDHAVAALLPLRDRPGMPRVLAPSAESWRTATDKDALLPLAARAGFGVPPTIRFESPDAIAGEDSLAAYTPGFVKPHRSVVTIDGRLRKLGVTPAGDPAHALEVLRALPAEAFPVLLQARVDGPGAGIFALRWNGEIRASFGHRRLREIPPTGGVSVYRESVPVDPVMLRNSEALLSALNWEGVAMIECKQDRTTGAFVIMEVNGRFWGSLQLALDAGVDFPNLLIDCLEGRLPAEPPASAIGVRTRWEWGEMDHLWQRARAGGRNGRGLLREAGGALADILRWSRRDRLEVLRLRDPLPFAVETARRLKLLR